MRAHSMWLVRVPALVAIGAGLIATNAAMKTLLLVGVDMIHRLTDPNDPGMLSME